MRCDYLPLARGWRRYSASFPHVYCQRPAQRCEPHGIVGSAVKPGTEAGSQVHARWEHEWYVRGVDTCELPNDKEQRLCKGQI